MHTPQVKYIEITTNHVDQRVDNFLLRELKGVPKSHIYKLLRKGEVRVNKKRTKPTYKLQIGDILRLPPIRHTQTVAAQPSTSLRKHLQQAIIFEDKTMLVLNKPQGLAVHGGSGIHLGAIEALRALYPEHQYLELIHRLDKATSGCLLVAKKRSMLRHIQTEMRERRIEKIYLALVEGRLEETIDCQAALQKTTAANGEKWVHVDANGKPAHSVFTPVSTHANTTLVEVTIHTGRTHQIRVHATHIGHPVIGDGKYGQKSTAPRMFLHASRLSFALPDGTPFTIEASLDPIFQAALHEP